jgi:hypothetical protein
MSTIDTVTQTWNTLERGTPEERGIERILEDVAQYADENGGLTTAGVGFLDTLITDLCSLNVKLRVLTPSPASADGGDGSRRA